MLQLLCNRFKHRRRQREIIESIHGSWKIKVHARAQRTIKAHLRLSFAVRPQNSATFQSPPTCRTCPKLPFRFKIGKIAGKSRDFTLIISYPTFCIKKRGNRGKVTGFRTYHMMSNFSHNNSYLEVSYLERVYDRAPENAQIGIIFKEKIPEYRYSSS